LKYFPQVCSLEDPLATLNAVEEDSVTKKQQEEDVELFGDCLGPFDHHKDEVSMVHDLQVQESDVINEDALDTCVEGSNQLLSEAMDLDQQSDSEAAPLTIADLALELPQQGENISPLQSWLDRTVPPANPKIVHSLRQDKERHEDEMRHRELEEIEIFRNVHIVPNLQDENPIALPKVTATGEDELELGARIYYRNILDRYPLIEHYLARRLAEANWFRAKRLGTAKFPKFKLGDFDKLESRAGSRRNSFAESASTDIDIVDQIGQYLFRDYLSHSRPDNPPDVDLLTPYGLSFKEDRGKSRRHTCAMCSVSFKRLKQLERHKKHIHSQDEQFKCPDCPSTFKNKDVCERHWHLEHSDVAYNCPDCGKRSLTAAERERHVRREHPNSIYALFGANLTPSRNPPVDHSSRELPPPLVEISNKKETFVDSLIGKISRLPADTSPC
jgi:predicted RNA-binding Zn-ribbon protein involved in translation (DUF1610 family)